MLPLTLWFALTLAGMDAGGEMYTAPSGVYSGLAYSQELAVRVMAGPLFAGGSLEAFEWLDPSEAQFWPNRLSSSVGVGLDFEWLEIGYEHRCDHPVTPFRSFKSSPPLWEGWSDRVYIRIEGKITLTPGADRV